MALKEVLNKLQFLSVFLELVERGWWDARRIQPKIRIETLLRERHQSFSCCAGTISIKLIDTQALGFPTAQRPHHIAPEVDKKSISQECRVYTVYVAVGERLK